MPIKMNKLLKTLGLRGSSADQLVRCGRFSIRLPHDHLLPVYQRKHPSYDRFLPFLAGKLAGGSTVIDVGANCGDTVAAMAAQNPQLHYLCIEPEARFLRYLQANIAAMQQVEPGLHIEAVAAMVGKAITQASLAGRNGSKHAVPGTGEITTTTLDEIVQAASRPPVRLLKSDVDGYDYDVIHSALALIRRDRPLVYYECQFSDEPQRNGFEGLMADLAEAGYTHWTVFDNFGEVMLAGTQPAQIRQLMNYAWRQNHKRATRTIYYYDILAAVASDAAIVDSVLEAYEARA
jgi:FkbM family methyltransferase